MSAFGQIRAVTAMNLRSIPLRWGASSVIVVGMACVVGVVVSVLSMSAGFVRTVENSGRPDRAIVLSQNAQYENASSLTRDSVVKISDAPGIRKAADGKPIVSAEIATNVTVAKKSDGLDGYAALRGVGREDAALRPEIKLTAGRMFQPAVHELIAGRFAQAQFAGLEVGNKISLSDGDWTVVGAFEAGGGAADSELLADSETVLSAMRAANFKSVTVMLESPNALGTFKNALTSDPTLAVDVDRETDFFRQQSKSLNEFLTVIAYGFGGIMGAGAIFGALNTMYSAVSARTREIATLRAIGFGADAIVASVFAEALGLALIGAALGAAVAWYAFNGNLHAFGGLVITLTVTRALMILGLSIGTGIGFIGGLFPAIRAARLPIAQALRQT